MAIFKDVVINIQRLTAALASPSNGKCLILTTQVTQPYKEYSSLAALGDDYDSETEAYKAASALFSQEPSVDKIAIVGIEKGVDSFTDVIDGLNQVVIAKDFTFLVSNEIDTENIGELASWATANKKFYGATIPFSQVGTIPSPNSDYVFYFVSENKNEYPEAALIGRCSTFPLGSATWMFKKLNGVTPQKFDDQATAVELINEEKFITYVEKYGIQMTTGGFVTSGEYIDVMLGVLWIQTDMEIRIQNLLVNTPKIPYDNGGIALIAAQVEATLKDATTRTIIRKGEGGLGEYEIQIPDVSDINPNDIANRELKDIAWQAKLAGAIHHVVINGLVQY